MKKKDIEILHLKTNSHAQTLSKEAAETAEMNASVAVLSASRDTFARTKSTLLAQISATQAAIDAKLASQRQYASHLSAQTVHDIPELDFWVSNLGLRIEGAGRDDRLKFVFTHVDERDWEREAWFELSTAARDYEVLNTSPKLEREAVERVVERVNETRELGGLLKGMRGLFVEAVRA
jgi:kinetochore protein Spc25